MITGFNLFIVVFAAFQNQQSFSFVLKEHESFRISSRCHGGYEYFSDPDVVVDRSQTHMIFGSRCEEVPTQLPSGEVLFGLRQIGEQVVEMQANNYGQALVNCLSHEPGLLRGKTVIEFGSSTFSTAAACLGAARVFVCHRDPLTMRQVEYAHSFLNSNKVSIPPVLSTYQLQANVPLPYLGGEDSIVAFTSKDLSYLGEVFEQKPAFILVPTQCVPSEQISIFQESYPESQGIFILSP